MNSEFTPTATHQKSSDEPDGTVDLTIEEMFDTAIDFVLFLKRQYEQSESEVIKLRNEIDALNLEVSCLQSYIDSYTQALGKCSKDYRLLCNLRRQIQNIQFAALCNPLLAFGLYSSEAGREILDTNVYTYYEDDTTEIIPLNTDGSGCGTTEDSDIGSYILPDDNPDGTD